MKNPLAILVALILMSVSLTACSSASSSSSGSAAPSQSQPEAVPNPMLIDGYFNITMEDLFESILASDPEAGKTYESLRPIGPDEANHNEVWFSDGEYGMTLTFNAHETTSKVQRIEIEMSDYAEDSPAIAQLGEWTEAIAGIVNAGSTEETIQKKIIAPLNFPSIQGTYRSAALDGVQYYYKIDSDKKSNILVIAPAAKRAE